MAPTVWHVWSTDPDTLKWTEADVKEFINRDPVHGPRVRTLPSKGLLFVLTNLAGQLQTIRTVASQSVSAGVAGGVLGFGISVAAQGFSMRPVASLAPAATAGFLASIATFFVAEEVRIALLACDCWLIMRYMCIFTDMCVLVLGTSSDFWCQLVRSGRFYASVSQLVENEELSALT
jgi:hypothetical protein